MRGNNLDNPLLYNRACWKAAIGGACRQLVLRLCTLGAEVAIAGSRVCRWQDRCKTLQEDGYVELLMEVKQNMFMLLACAAYVT